MALKDGHHKTKRREGTRNCFFCQRDVTCMQITWPEIKAIYEYCNIKYPAALCCQTCHDTKSKEELYKKFWVFILVTECDKYLKNKPSIIKDKKVFNNFLEQIKENKKFLALEEQ